MADPIEAGLLAAVKALDDVVAGSVDPANPLAREQLKLVSRYLGFLRQRVPLGHERERFELRHALDLGRQLQGLGLPGGTPQLDAAVERATRAAQQHDATSAALRSAAAALNTAMSVLVRSAPDLPDAARRQVEQAIVKASRRLFDVQRAWYLPMGFEPDACAVPELEQALSGGP